MAPQERVLRFPQSRKKSAFVLIQAVSTGRHPLDLKLLGTDGYAPFAVSCKLPSLQLRWPMSLPARWEFAAYTFISPRQMDSFTRLARYLAPSRGPLSTAFMHEIASVSNVSRRLAGNVSF